MTQGSAGGQERGDTPPLAIAILAGGQSRRMGRDKAALVVDGLLLLERTVRIARQVTPQVLVIGRPPERAGAGVTFLGDPVPEIGPAGGLLGALRHVRAAGTDVLALACDLPRLQADALRWLAGEAAAAGDAEHGVVGVRGDRIEPLFAVYRPAVLPLLEARVAAGRYSLRGLIEEGSFARAPVPDVLAPRLMNLNTPEQYAALTDGDSPHQ